jgi:hypothetical protein
MEVDAQQVMASQGTRLSERNPWETYGAEMEARMSPEMASAVAEYAERRYESDQTSSENKEELHRQREISTELAKQYQWLNPEEYADFGARIGRVMSHAEFINTLRKSGIHCHYRQHPQADKAVLYTSKYGCDTAEIACWVQVGQMPELSIMRFDDHGVPLDERRRGWRTSLLQLILKGIITEEEANKAFGRPKETEQFHRYNSTLQNFRNAGSSL